MQESFFSADGEPLRRLQVLLAEDDPTHADVATWVLRGIECRVRVVTDGATASMMAKRDAFDLIFMDCRMPVMDGLEATRSIRAWEVALSRPRTPIVAMTASVMPNQVQRYLDCGMDDVLPKPIVFEDLARMVSTWTRRRRSASTAMDDLSNIERRRAPAALLPLPSEC